MENIEKKNKAGCCSLNMGRGCEFCGCGEEISACACEGCFKLHTTDWLAGYPGNSSCEVVEVRFKNTRRGYYINAAGLSLAPGDIVAVEASPGHDIGIVSMTGDLVARQMKRVGYTPLNGEFRKIYRKAKPYDIEKWQEAIALEHGTMIRARQIAADMNLNMKIGDVEYQGDKIKAIFYYIADERVDFRKLIKVFAEQFHIRVEMKQIGARQEAGRIGGLGSCGRELCCASWISSFSSVTTNAARAQDISLNPQKLAGQCSKLKCCMIYEYDTYMDAREDLPRVHAPLQTQDGDYHFIKSDILARKMFFGPEPHSMMGMVGIPASRVREIQKLNSKGIKPEHLAVEGDVVRKEDPGFINVIGEDSITRFDQEKRRKRGGKGRGKDRYANGEKRERDTAGRSQPGEQRENKPQPDHQSNRDGRKRSDNKNRDRHPARGDSQDNRQASGQNERSNLSKNNADKARQGNNQRPPGEGRPVGEGNKAVPRSGREQTAATKNNAANQKETRNNGPRQGGNRNRPKGPRPPQAGKAGGKKTEP